MSCCGKKRAAINNPLSSTSTPISQAAPHPVVWFQYTGTNILSVIGKATNSSYRFLYNGAMQAVDRRDSVILATVPGLRQVSEPRSQRLG